MQRHNKWHGMAVAIIVATAVAILLYPANELLAVGDFAMICKGITVAIMALCMAVHERKQNQMQNQMQNAKQNAKRH